MADEQSRKSSNVDDDFLKKDKMCFSTQLVLHLLEKDEKTKVIDGMKALQLLTDQLLRANVNTRHMYMPHKAIDSREELWILLGEHQPWKIPKCGCRLTQHQ